MKKRKSKILKIALVFLILGLYVDVRMMRKGDGICVGTAKQRTFNIQVIVPFRPQREIFYFGVGNRHYNHNRYTTYYIDKERVDDEGSPIVLGKKTIENGCSVRYEGEDRSWFGRHAHYINLRPFNRIREDGIVDWHFDERYMTQEDYKEWYK